MNSDKDRDIEPGQSDFCHVTGLPILRKPEWTDVNFGKDYRVTVSIVGDSILRVQPSGYVTLPDQKNVLRFTDQVPAKAISGGQPYVQIEDWSNFRGSSLAARKYYIDEMPKRDRISGVIFCHVSAMFKMSVKLGKHLSMVKFPVHIVDDYSEAVRLALEIQSKEKALEDKPVIAPSYEKNLSKKAFPSDEESVCPVTLLPVTTKLEWTDIRIDDNYSVSFRLIGKAILFTVLNGTLSMAGTQKLFAERERVLIEAGLLDNKYAEIVDYSMYAGYPSKEIRMMLANFLVKEVDTGNLLGFWVFNPPLFIRWMYNVSTKLYKRPVSVSVVRDYKEAVENAVNVLNKSGVDVGSKQYKRFTKDEWGLELEDYGTCFELIGDDLIHTVPHGVMKECHIEKIIDLHEKVLEETGLTEKGSYYRIINWENLEKTTWKARKMFIDATRDLNRKVPCKLSVIFGLNKFMRTIIGFSKQFVPVPVATARNFEEAMAIIEREKKREPETEVAKNKKKPEETFQDEKIKNYCDELLEYMGTINWDREGTTREDISDSNPFKPVFDALSIVKEDVDDLFRERKQSEERLRKSEERYRHIIEKTTDVVYTADPMGYFSYVNPPGEKLTGYPTDELIGKHFTELTRRDWRERIQLFYLKQFKEREHETRLEFPITTKTGEERWVEQIVTLLSEGNRVTGFQSIVRDISIRKQAEDALRESERKYRDVFENVSDFIYIHDLEGNFTETNLVWKKELGLTEDDLVNLSVRDLIPKRFRHQFDDYLNRVKANGEDEGLMTLMTKGGGERIIEYKNSLIYGSTGPIGVRGSARDITEQMHAQRDLRRSEKKYRTILENIEDGYFEVDLSGKLTFFNDALCRITGYPKDELMGINNREYMDEETAKKVYKTYVRIYQTGEPVKGLEYSIRKGGNEKHVETSVSLMKDRKGEPIGFRGILRDVTERKQAEEKIRRYSENLEQMVEERTDDLKKSEEKYRTILENIEDGYYEVDLAGNLTFFNNSLCKITGYSEDELKGTNNREFMDEKNAQKVYREYNRVYETGIPTKRLDWEVVKKNKIKGFVETSISPIIRAEGQPVGFRGILRDVTERKELEFQITEKSKMAEEATKAKSEFLANMSHEIRTPLNGIVGMVELAMDTDLDDNQKNIFHTINTEANSLLEVINRILDFSKIEAGMLEIEEIPFDLKYLVEEVAGSLAYRAERTGLEIASFIEPDFPSRLIGDPGRLRQVLVNLTGNALKFTKEGEIYIKVEMVEELENRAKVRFSVKDTGIGIPKDKQKTIFESFVQADGSTSREYGGTGLGTTISKQLAELMGGEIGAESEEGKGSTFWFTAVFKKEPRREVVLPKEDVDLSDLKVLVVDDNKTNRFILAEYLRSWGCMPVEAEDGFEALDMLRESAFSTASFDLILTAVQMLKMDGFELIVGEGKEKKSCNKLLTFSFKQVVFYFIAQWDSKILNKNSKNYSKMESVQDTLL